MKRRLSVAMALVGDPLVCYLDEPSTGFLDVACCEETCVLASHRVTHRRVKKFSSLCILVAGNEFILHLLAECVIL